MQYYKAISMSHAKKLLDKICLNHKDWRIAQLETVAKQHGINIRKSTGSHVVFEYPGSVEQLCVPAHRPIKPIYVKKFVSLIDAIGTEI